MLTKNLIAADIASDTGIKVNLVKHVLDSLADLAAAEIEEGEDFIVPGVVKIAYTYRAPQKKGARWKKGEERTGFGGITSVAEEDSPPVTELIRLKAMPTGAVGRLRPGTKPDVQKAFLRSKAGKTVRSRKAK